jgi:glutamate dehydrogenase
MTQDDIGLGGETSIAALSLALAQSALPGEAADFGDAARSSAAEFLLATARTRFPDTPAIALESIAGEGARRRMRIAVVNDDMPFLVDSVAATLTARQLHIHRLLHPVLSVDRSDPGPRYSLPDTADDRPKESLIYLEVDRTDARNRRSLEIELQDVLQSVRSAVADWSTIRNVVAGEAARLGEGEGAALLRWFLERHFTLLGHRTERHDGSIIGTGHGILGQAEQVLWSPAIRADAMAWFARGGDAPLILKSNLVSTVHRRAPLDMLVLPSRRNGVLAGISILVGLWTSAALRAEPEQVPVLRSRFADLEAKHRFNPAGHSGKALRHALSALPHDVLIAVDDSSLETIALNAMSLADRPRPKLVMVPGPLKCRLFAFAWLPREDVSTPRRKSIGEFLESRTGGTLLSWELEPGEGGLGLLRFTLELPVGTEIPEPLALDTAFEAMLRGWDAALEAELVRSAGPARATRLMLEWATSFPPSYRDRVGAREAAADVVRMAALVDDDAREVRLYQDAADEDRRLRLKIYRRGGLLPLSQAVPALENFGFLVLEQLPTQLDGDERCYIHEFVLEVDGVAAAARVVERSVAIEAALVATLENRSENDQFNALMVYADLDQHGVTLFRAWFRYLRQTGVGLGLSTVAEVLRRSPEITGSLISLFNARHDPGQATPAAADGAETSLEAALARVAAIEDDRILRLFKAVILATLRTNAFATPAAAALAFKLDSAAVPGLPRPLPWREIWVYSPRVEGIHLRSSPIARGGLRWSDRRDDFRTEILGLMKAQVVKNAVIVPTGAKGGFYPKRLPSPADRDAFLAEGAESYRIFIRALLSVTDNLADGRVVPPAGVFVRDGDDPYLVVAADKGTAAFSDVANAIAIDHGFWLGDAFASGGSVGYDHKAMGITARGAWVSVQRHFAEQGIDVQSDPIRVIGCGDMSGDVFGNGMLLSRSLRLVAAFDHRHIFLDPKPDPALSYAERARLFALPRSSWDDYDWRSISPGGGVFSRSQKSIPLSAEVREMLGVSADQLDPASLIAAILRCQADLLWFGGIGTYVKARSESHSQVGDPANDALRIDADSLRVKVIGEGANLGITQAGRIAFALRGGRLNTDFIDNSAGVDCSDNEVNIKIALNGALSDGLLSKDRRNPLLAEMTDDVAALVLADNHMQNLALSYAEQAGTDALPSYLRLIETLEQRGSVDRIIDGFAPSEDLQRRADGGRGLTRPELSVLLSHSKLAIKQDVEASGLVDTQTHGDLLREAFPPAVREVLGNSIASHRLAPQIIATRISNQVVNRLGPSAAFEIARSIEAPLADVALAFITIDKLFDLETLWKTIDEAEASGGAYLTDRAMIVRFAQRQVIDLVQSVPGGLRLQSELDSYRAALHRTREALNNRRKLDGLEEPFADFPLACRLDRLNGMDGVIGTIAHARRLGIDEAAATSAYVRLRDIVRLDILDAPAKDQAELVM